jgi:hypothetical protein
MSAENLGDLDKLFEKHGIDFSKPGFYDDPQFIEAESRDGSFLETYGKAVARRTYSEAYLARARREIPAIARLVWEELIKDGRLGACVDVSMILSRVLEQEGFWNYLVKGSLTINFAASHGLTPRFFWSWDLVQQRFAAAHAWVVAPPFGVVDISLKQQPFKKGQGQELLPDMMVSEHLKTVDPDPRDIFSPSFLLAEKTLPGKSISKFAPRLRQFFKDFPPLVGEHDGTQMKYTTVAISAPDAPFPNMVGWPINGRTGYEFYMNVLRPQLKHLRST